MPRKGSGVTTIRKLRDRCVWGRSKPLDCWEWKGGYHRGTPRMWVFDPGHNEMRVVAGARAAAIFAGLDVGPGMRAWMGCMHPGCVNPEHVIVGTYADWGKWQADNDVWKGSPLRIAAATATWRATIAKLNMDKARQIRSLKGSLPQSERARMFDVGVKTISDIDCGRRWKETSPWQGLGA
jgi:hypothetical protein